MVSRCISEVNSSPSQTLFLLFSNLPTKVMIFFVKYFEKIQCCDIGRLMLYKNVVHRQVMSQFINHVCPIWIYMTNLHVGVWYIEFKLSYVRSHLECHLLKIALWRLYDRFLYQRTISLSRWGQTSVNLRVISRIRLGSVASNINVTTSFSPSSTRISSSHCGTEIQS